MCDYGRRILALVSVVDLYIGGLLSHISNYQRTNEHRNSDLEKKEMLNTCQLKISDLCDSSSLSSWH